MRLRGHHLFCTALFSGHGYDAAFTARMAEVISAARDGELMTLAVGPDEICAACPHRTPGDGCALGTENVLHRDREALRVLGLADGDAVTWAGSRPLLTRVTEEDFQAVCGDCRWQREGLCTVARLMERLV